jgi:hypothetical protein
MARVRVFLPKHCIPFLVLLIKICFSITLKLTHYFLSLFSKTLNILVSIVNKNLLYIEATNNIQMSGFGIDIFDQSLTRKGKKDTKHIQLLKVALNELHSLLMDEYY